jgi:hypothetical protein
MKNEEDVGQYVEECLEILNENVNILSDIEYELNDQKEDKIIPNMKLIELIDMTRDVAESSKIKKAEFNFMQRYLEELNF